MALTLLCMLVSLLSLSEQRISRREASPYTDMVEGDILVDRVEVGTPGMLQAVVTTDTDRSTLHSEYYCIFGVPVVGKLHCTTLHCILYCTVFGVQVVGKLYCTVD